MQLGLRTGAWSGGEKKSAVWFNGACHYELRKPKTTSNLTVNLKWYSESVPYPNNGNITSDYGFLGLHGGTSVSRFEFCLYNNNYWRLIGQDRYNRSFSDVPYEVDKINEAVIVADNTNNVFSLIVNGTNILSQTGGQAGVPFSANKFGIGEIYFFGSYRGGMKDWGVVSAVMENDGVKVYDLSAALYERIPCLYDSVSGTYLQPSDASNVSFINDIGLT